MKRVVIAWWLTVAMAAPLWAAGPNVESAPAQAQPATSWVAPVEIAGGVVMMVAGIATAFYGFGHPTGQIDSNEVLVHPQNFPHRSRLGYAGAAIAGGGLALAWLGLAHTSVRVAPGELSVQHTVGF